MAEPEATAQPSTTPPVEAKKDDKSKFIVYKACRHCGENRPASHQQWCKKNPNRSTRVGGPAKPAQSDATAPAAAPKKKRAPRAPKAPEKPAEKSPEAFLNDRRAELQKPAPPPEKNDPAPPPRDEKKGKKDWKTWGIVGFGVVAALFFLWRLSGAPNGEEPEETEPTAAPDERVDGVIPGVGPVHIPDFDQGSVPR